MARILSIISSPFNRFYKVSYAQLTQRIFILNAHSSVTQFDYDGEVVCVEEILDDKEKVYYASQPSGQESAPKLLIFNDFSSGMWTAHKILKLRQLLEGLLQSQFQIYYHKWGKWFAFSLKTLDLQLQDYQTHVKASPNVELCKSAEIPLNTALKQILCLDYFEMQHLWDPQYDPSLRQVFSSDVGTKKFEYYEAAKEKISTTWQCTVIDDVLDTGFDFVPDTAIQHLALGWYSRDQKVHFSVEEGAFTVYGSDGLRKTQDFTRLNTVTMIHGREEETAFLAEALGERPNQIESLNITGHEADLHGLIQVNWSRLKILSYESCYHSQGRYDKTNVQYILKYILGTTTNLTQVELSLNDLHYAPGIELRFFATLIHSFC